MKKLIHGGDVYQNPDCIDFSANINPLGPPDSVKTVSYTHLSNRQSDRRSDFQPGIPNAVSETSQDGGRAVGNSGVRICAGTERIQTGKQASGSETSGRDQRVERPDAVSYTHLDVYKRQRQDFGQG